VSRYILDTDCVSEIFYNHPHVTANAAKHQVAVTIVTVQELFNGWVGKINDPSLVHNLPGLYSKLWTTVKYLQTIEVLDFTPEADTCLKKLLKDHLPRGKIACKKICGLQPLPYPSMLGRSLATNETFVKFLESRSKIGRLIPNS
jgi:tRNA(fMet)-specific endonuclease VapC